MKELLLFRHGKAVDPEEAPTDHERGLRPKGRRSATAMGELLSERKLLPDLILTSDAVRARETAELCESAFPTRVDVLPLEALYDCGPGDYLTLVGRQPEVISRLMIVAHNPTIEALIHDLTSVAVGMKTGTIARLRLNISSWRGPMENAELVEVLET